MIGFIPLFIIWRTFSSLCEKFYKTKWKFILLAIGIYVFTIIIVAFVIGIGYFIVSPQYEITASDEFIINIISTIFGIIAVVIFHKYLKRKWQDEIEAQQDEIGEIGKNYE